MKRLIDTHCHVFAEEFRQDIHEVISRAVESGVEYLLLPNINNRSVVDMMGICDVWPDLCKPMIGLHPEDLEENFHSQLDELKRILDADRGKDGSCRFIGIGETGLDLYWDKERINDQIESFRIQLEWALQYDLPVSIHSRESFPQLLDILSDYRGRGLRGVFHCFSGSVEEAKVLLGFEGFMFGIGGIVTFRKSLLPEILPTIPLERVVLETDSPYLTPVPFRGKRNEPSFLTFISSRIAQIYGCSDDYVASVTSQNASNLFRL
ncbi:MAG: TatD family hydrolase [Bacteroidaceae bacterium]|nr:TatD family hydrolase [Bacteroidaceae bacterium]